jgi:hypothetical protein
MQDLSFLYEIQPYTLEKAKQLGLTVKPSPHPRYKIDVYDEYNNYIASVGHKEYYDFPTYIKERGLEYALKRRELYKLRHKKDSKKIGSRGWLASTLLW